MRRKVSPAAVSIFRIQTLIANTEPAHVGTPKEPSEELHRGRPWRQYQRAGLRPAVEQAGGSNCSANSLKLEATCTSSEAARGELVPADAANKTEDRPRL